MIEITIALSLTAAAGAYAAIARADGDGIEHREARTPASNPNALPHHLVSPAAR